MTEQAIDRPAGAAADEAQADGRSVAPARRRAPVLRRPSAPALVLVGLWLVACGFVLRSAYLARLSISNFDGLSYLSIARQYAEGSTQTALNAFWSPFVSWAMVPLLRAGVGDTTSFVLVSAAGAAVGIAVGTALVRRATGGAFWPAALFLVCSTVFFVAAVPLTTPDLLVVSWVLVLLAVLHGMTPVVRAGLSRGLVLRAVGLGLVCALGYVVKLYLVPVMLVVVPVWLGWALAQRSDGRRPARREAVRTAAVVLATALATFALVVSPWVAALSAKYDGFTLGSSFTVNIEHKFDPTTGAEVEPELRMWEPPNDQAVSYGEDRTFSGDDDAPAAAGSTPWGERIAYYVDQRVEAFPHYLNRVATIAPFAFVTVAAYLVLLGLGRFRGPEHRLATLAAVVWAVYFAGYAAITSASSGGGNVRYYWPLLAVWLVLVCALLPSFWHACVRRGPRARRALAVLLVVLVPLSVVWQAGVGRAAPFAVGDPPRNALTALTRVPKPSMAKVMAGSQLSDVIGRGDRLVANNFRSTAELAYELRAQVYGRSAQPYDPADPAFRALLQEYDIDYYLYYQPLLREPEPPTALSAVGPVVTSYEAAMPCADVAGARPEPCRLYVVEVTSG